MRYIATLLAIGFASASAQVLPPPILPFTYSASFSGLAIPQSAAMDAVCLVGAQRKIVRVLRIAVSGIKTTAQTSIINLVKRSGASTGGTSSTAPAAPLDSKDPSAGASLLGYSAANTPAPGSTMRTTLIGFSSPTSPASVKGIVWDFDPTMLMRPPILLAQTDQLCLSIPGALSNDGVALDVDVTWTEQPIR